MNDDLIQKFGYSEMYEWENIPQNKIPHGNFVTFSKSYPNKIELYGKSENDLVLGITTICSVCDSNNPDEWHFKNYVNEFGDTYLQKEVLAVGCKEYDQYNEISYISTKPWEHLIPITNKQYNPELQYVKRTNRKEWVRVNLLGKCIVYDNGNCKPGDYCMPYVGKIKDLFGSAIPYDGSSKNKYYVLERVSNNTIMIINK